MRQGSHGALAKTIAILAALLAAAAIEHGVGEILQGSTRPSGLIIESWPGSGAFEALSGEPAMTVIPNVLVAGVITILVAAAFAWWAIWRVEQRHGPLVLGLLSVALLLVGGGLAPPLMGLILTFGATRIGAPARRPTGRPRRVLAAVWPWTVAGSVLGYLTLVPGMVIFAGFALANPGFVYAVSGFSFLALFVALAAARAKDLVSAASGSAARPEPAARRTVLVR